MTPDLKKIVEDFRAEQSASGEDPKTTEQRIAIGIIAALGEHAMNTLMMAISQAPDDPYR